MQAKHKTDKLACAIERANGLVKPMSVDVEVPTIDAYPVSKKKLEGDPNPTDQESSWAEAIEGGKKT